MRAESTWHIAKAAFFTEVRAALLPKEDDALIKPLRLERVMLLILLPMFALVCLAVTLLALHLGGATWFERYQLIPSAVVFLGLAYWCYRTDPKKIRRVRYATLVFGPGIVLERLVIGLILLYRDGYVPGHLGAIAVWLILSACLFVYLMPGRRALLWGLGYYGLTAVMVVGFLVVNPHELPPILMDELLVSVLVGTPTFLVLTAMFSQLRASYGSAYDRNVNLESIAMQDGLTGLFNRRAFAAFMRRARSRQARKKTPVCMALIDIDFFKRVNDTFGHQKGDEVLVQVADVLTKTQRRTDDVIRWGGEEFVILMEETSLRDAGLVADRVREIIQNTEILRDRPITVSIGVAELMPGEDDSEFFGRADAALYDAKDCGRNRVVVRSRPKRPSNPNVAVISEKLDLAD